MRRIECEFEAEALAAVFQSRWPERTDARLREHIAGCEICSDVVAIAGAFDGDHAALAAEAAVPDAGRVWRLAQLRARREAIKAAGRPITAAQVIAFACAMGLLGACFGATSTWFQAALGWVTSSVTGFDLALLLSSASRLFVEHSALIVGLAAVVFLLPTFVYVALGRD